MLVLTRCDRESILLPTLDIKLTVLTIDDGSVRIGIDAPKNVPILREELVRRKDKNRSPEKCAS